MWHSLLESYALFFWPGSVIPGLGNSFPNAAVMCCASLCQSWSGGSSAVTHAMNMTDLALLLPRMKPGKPLIGGVPVLGFPTLADPAMFTYVIQAVCGEFN